jgi:aryl-alcohol dehydrogenase-like predicted oxidoreductase
LGFACEHADPVAVKALIDTGSFQMINVWYDMLNPTAAYGHIPGMNVGHEYDGIIPYAQAAGVGVATIRPLGGGVLTDHAIGGGARHALAGGGLSRSPSIYEEMREQALPLGFLSRAGQHTVSEAAYRFVLDTPGVCTVLGGFSELAHLEEAVGVSSSAPLSPEIMARIKLVWRANYGRQADHAWASA